MIHLDTHVVVWLYAGLREKLSERAGALIEQEDLRASPMVHLELQYLHEIGRLSVPGTAVLADLGRRIGLGLAGTPMDAAVASALPLGWTRDPFDRLIAGCALAEGVPLLTADRRMLDHLAVAVWD